MDVVRALFVCGVIAGPLFVLVFLIEGATTWPGIPSGSAWTLVLDVFSVHQVGVLVRQLIQNMQVLGANRLAKGGSHRPGMLTCLLFVASSALFGSHAAVELLTVEPLRPLAR